MTTPIVSLTHTWPLTSYSLLLKRSPRGVPLPDRTEMQAASSVYKLILCRWAVAVKYFVYSCLILFQCGLALLITRSRSHRSKFSCQEFRHNALSSTMLFHLQWFRLLLEYPENLQHEMRHYWITSYIETIRLYRTWSTRLCHLLRAVNVQPL